MAAIITVDKVCNASGANRTTDDPVCELAQVIRLENDLMGGEVYICSTKSPSRARLKLTSMSEGRSLETYR